MIASERQFLIFVQGVRAFALDGRLACWREPMKLRSNLGGDFRVGAGLALGRGGRAARHGGVVAFGRLCLPGGLVTALRFRFVIGTLLWRVSETQAVQQSGAPNHDEIEANGLHAAAVPGLVGSGFWSLPLPRNAILKAGTTTSNMRGPTSMPPTTTVARGRCT